MTRIPNSRDDAAETDDRTLSLTRRGALGAAGALGLSALAPTAAASHWSNDDREGFPDYYYDPQTPPERDGETIVYNGNNHVSLQAAYNQLTEGDTLLITPGTYEERINLYENYTDHVTIRGPGGGESVPTIKFPETAENAEKGYVIGTDQLDVNDLDYADLDAYEDDNTELVGSYTGGRGDQGETRITVADSSLFSAGDDIHISEARNALGDTTPPGSSANDITREFRTVEAVEGDDLVLTHALDLPFPNEETTSVEVMEWNATDVRFANLNIDGAGVTEDALEDEGIPGAFIANMLTVGLKEPLYDNLHFTNVAVGSCIQIGICYRTRTKNVLYEQAPRYGTNHIWNTSIGLVTDAEHRGPGRYVVKADSGATSIRGRDLRGKNLGRTSVDAHWNAWWPRYEDVTAEENGVTTLRTVGTVVDGFHQDGDADEPHSIIMAQAPDKCVAKNGTITGKTRGDVFHFQTGMDDRDYDVGGDITFENIEIDAYEDGRGADEIGSFDDEGDEIEGTVTFRDVYYDGEPLTREDVESWDNYDIAQIDELVVETT